MESSREIELLLAEDDPNDAALALHALRKYNLSNKIQVVEDGAEALEFIFSKGRYEGRAGGDPKVLLLDIKLPLVDGLEVLEHVRENPKTTNLPVVLLTSSAEESDIRRGYELKANSYIVKPVDFDKFVEAMREIGMYWLVLNRPPA